MPTTGRPSLPDLQNWMRWVLTFPSGVGDVIGLPAGKAPLPKNWTRGPEPRRWLSVIGESPEVSQETRLSIYGDGYFLRIVGVMASNFSALRNVLGAHDFDEHVAREYLVKYPSTFKCIDNIGLHMHEFLARHPIHRRFPFLSDLARLEWAFHESFYSDDLPLFDASVLRHVPESRWPNARIQLDPSVRLVDLSWNVLELWRADGKWTAQRIRAIKKRRSGVIIYRNPEPQVHAGEESPGSFALLTAFKDGLTLGEALKRAERKGLTPQAAMSHFSEWMRLGIIRKVAFS